VHYIREDFVDRVAKAAIVAVGRFSDMDAWVNTDNELLLLKITANILIFRAFYLSSS
jgi:hypothetical protein